MGNKSRSGREQGKKWSAARDIGAARKSPAIGRVNRTRIKVEPDDDVAKERRRVFGLNTKELRLARRVALAGRVVYSGNKPLTGGKPPQKRSHRHRAMYLRLAA